MILRRTRKARRFVVWRELQRNPMVTAGELADLLKMSPTQVRVFCEANGFHLVKKAAEVEDSRLHAMPVDAVMTGDHSPQFRARYMSPSNFSDEDP